MSTRLTLIYFDIVVGPFVARHERYYAKSSLCPFHKDRWWFWNSFLGVTAAFLVILVGFQLGPRSLCRNQ